MSNRIRWCAMVMLFCVSCFVNECRGAIMQEVLVYNGVELRHWLYSPANRVEGLPLLVYLHGVYVRNHRVVVVR